MRRRWIQSIAVGAILGAVAVFFPAGEPRMAAVPTPISPKPEHRDYTQTIPGSKVSFDMVAVPGGEFYMGSPSAEIGRQPDEGPQHEVKVRPFWMGKCEVSWDEFDVWFTSEIQLVPKEKGKPIDEADAITRPTPPYVEETYGHERLKHPVISMSHHTAMVYCEWLSAKTGLTYRLPTEAEWEYACRAGSGSAYSFGDDPAKLDEYAWYRKNSPTAMLRKGTTHPVGSKKPNAFGLHDMHGNVMEWCLDHYEKDAYEKFAVDRLSLWPVLIPTERRFSHVARGGSWADQPDRLRSAARRPSDPSWIKHDPNEPKSIWWLTMMDVVGFRIVRPLEEQDNLKGLKSKVTPQSP